MPHEPDIKRAVAFVDGQNLFHCAKYAFGVGYPSYDPLLLAKAVCVHKNWQFQELYFYTGIPDGSDNHFWNHFWSAKLAVLGTRGVKTFSRPLKYNPKQIRQRDGSTATVLVGQEKGIDIRIALDVVRLAREGEYDVALIFSQDQDLSEAVDEVREISITQDRWIRVACAFPYSAACKHFRGINKTEWIQIDNAMYDACVDPNDYRPRY
jgi:uncharacterized LabA/DUF88 family protein